MGVFGQFLLKTIFLPSELLRQLNKIWTDYFSLPSSPTKKIDYLMHHPLVFPVSGSFSLVRFDGPEIVDVYVHFVCRVGTLPNIVGHTLH